MGEAKRKKAAAVASASQHPGDWNADSAPTIVPGKSCGACTKCCKLLGIAEIKKPAWSECVHVAPGLGCRIYSQRPRSCRQFICGWLLDPNMGPDLKPEVCHADDGLDLSS